MAEETSKTYVFGQDNSVMPLLASLFTQRGIDPSVLAMLSKNSDSDMFGGNWIMWIVFLLFLVGGGRGFGRGDDSGFIANQLNNDTGRDLLAQAIHGNGAAISQLATTLNTDISAVQTSINGVLSAIQSVGAQVGMSGLQTINAVESGNAALSQQFCQCCCDQKLLTTEQGYQSQIRTIEQTNQLGSQADRNTASITGAIADLKATTIDQFCALERRELQDKIDALALQNSTLRGQIDNAQQTASINSYVASLVAPLQAQVNTIAAKQPNTVPVEWPNLTAVNNTPQMGGFGYGYGFNPYGYGWGGSSYWG